MQKYLLRRVPRGVIIHKRSLISFLLLISLIMSIIVIPKGKAQIITEMIIYSNKDAGVFSYYPNTNYGTSAEAMVGYNNGYRFMFISFDLSNLTDITIINAKLSLYPHTGDVSVPLIIYIHNITSAWNETTITYNNSPTYLPSPITNSTITTLNTWYNWTVTDNIKYMVSNSSAWFGYFVYGESGLTIKGLSCRESTFDGRLIINYDSSPPTPPIDNSGIYFKMCLGIFCIIAIILAPVLADKFAKTLFGKIFLWACIWLFFGFLFYQWIYMW